MSECVQPIVVAGAIEGSKWVLVHLAGVPDGTRVFYSADEFGDTKDGLGLIPLLQPLRKSQQIKVYTQSTTCELKSCYVPVKPLAIGHSACESITFPTPGVLTGRLICNGVDLYREAHDGVGGYRPEILVIEDCIYCGGINPNCNV